MQTRVHILESSQLEGSYVGDLLISNMPVSFMLSPTEILSEHARNNASPVYVIALLQVMNLGA